MRSLTTTIANLEETTKPNAWRAVASWLDDGDEGTFQTLDAMRDLTSSRVMHPTVRQAASGLAGSVAPCDIPGQIGAVRAWLAANVRFLADPEGVELVHDPVLLLGQWHVQGRTFGDCDDVATLGAALVRSIGIPARFTVVAFHDRRAPFTHVFTEAFDGYAWRELDVTREDQAGDTSLVSRRATMDLATGAIIVNNQPQYFYGPSSPTLGFPVAAVVQGVTSLVGALGPFIHGGKDPERFKATDIAFAEAVKENAAALLFLRQRTGDYGVITIPGMAGQFGGWGSQNAKAYARKKYAEAVALLGQQGGGEGDPDSIPVPQPIQEAAMPVGILVAAGLAFYILSARRSRG